VIPSDCADVFIAFGGKVRLRIYFCPIIHRAQGYPSKRDLSTGLKRDGKLATWFEAIHSDIVKCVYCLLHTFTTSHPVRIWEIYDPKVCTRRGHFTQSADL
jgi:hypothetical protein